jgi:hypothetical protein
MGAGPSGPAPSLLPILSAPRQKVATFRTKSGVFGVVGTDGGNHSRWRLI